MYRLASAACLSFALFSPQTQALQTPAQKPQARPNVLENLLQLDANGDQTIDRAEVPESAQEAFDKILEQADRNHNSKLEAEEVRAALESLRSLGNNASAEAQARFKAMDTDNDGKVSRSEFKGPEALYNRLDANADGVIDDQEAAQAYRQMTARASLERLKRLDANADGKLTRDEYQGPAALFDRLDTDGDGTITTEEFNRAPNAQARNQPPAPEAPMLERLKRLDTNSDGKINRDEFPGADEAFNRLDANSDGVIDQSDRPGQPEARRRRPNAVPTDSPLFMRLDKNNDGKVTRDEAEGRAAQFFDRLDTNADGAVTPEEAASAADRLRARRPAAAKSAPAEPEPKPDSEPITTP